VSRIFLEGEKAQVSHSVEVLGGQTGIPKGLKKNRKFQREGRGNVLEFGGHGGGVEHFGISKGKGG